MLVAACLGATLAVPAIASASHIQGGSITSNITTLGHLQGTVNFLTAGTCTVGQVASEMPGVSVKNPSNVTQSISVAGTYTRCLPGSKTATGTYDVSLATLFGSAADGAYTVTANSCCRVSPIANISDPFDDGVSATFSTRVTKNGLTASSAPVLNSGVANTVPKGYAYAQNLNGTDPDGGSVTYASRAGQTGGPDSDIVTIGSNGVVSMTAGQTSTYNDGDHFAYTVRVSDSQGDYSDRDVLLKVSGNNAPPSIHGLSASAYEATAGAGAQTVNFTADDPNNASPKVDTISLALAAGAPSWVSLSAPAGNPANATLTVNPGSTVATGTYAFNIDGVDSDSSAPLFASEQVQVHVTNAAPATTLGTTPASVSNTAASSFAFSSNEGDATFECKLDTGGWATCASPKSYTGVTDGSHTFYVRATDAVLQTDASPDTYTWTVDTIAPAVPTIAKSPAAFSSSSVFEFDTPAGGSTECRIDGGTWTACTSPLTVTGLTDGAHTFAVRSYDPAGNRSSAASATWTLDTGAPAAPSIEQAPSAVAQVSTFAFTPTADATAECQIDGGDWVACSSPFAPAGLADGSHTFGLRLADSAGNRSQPTTAAWTLDTTAPTAPAFTAGPVGASTSKSATFDWTSEPGASVECRVDGGAWAACAAPFPLSGLAVGKHSFAVRQTDAAGNVGPAGSTGWTVGEEPTSTPPNAVQPVLGQDATVTVKGASASVGCQVDGGHLASCSVDVYAKIKSGDGDFGLSKTTASGSGKLVLIGTGQIVSKDGASRLAVDIELNAVGRKLMANSLSGIEVVLKIEAQTVEGPKLNTKKNAKLVPARQLIVPTEGLFASGKARIQPKAAKLLAKIAKQIGKVKAVRCIGHTDSLGTPAANEKLGYERARAVCAALKAKGVNAGISVDSGGERHPRATNKTVKGRALNRRVEISVRYR
jgi:outer membrane protein OmpA-like peptidoglycan-associated protein